MKQLQRVLFLLTVLYSTTAKSQGNNNGPVYLFIEKPCLKQDSLLLIKEKIRQIKIYKLELNDSSGYDKTIYGTWTLKTSATEIISSKWDGEAVEFYVVQTRKVEGNKIFENREHHQVIHFIKDNQIFRTNDMRYDGDRIESGCLIFKTNYTYDRKGFLIEADYCAPRMKDENIPIRKFLFEYIK